MTSTIDQILAKAKPATAAIKLCLDGSLLGEIDLLQDQINEFASWEPATMSDADPRTPIRERLEQLREQARQPELSQEFRFQALGDREWADLLAAHPAREDNDDDAGRWNSETFPAALIAASSVEPKLTVEDVQKLWGVFNAWQRDALFTSAYGANRRVVDIPFSPSNSTGAASSESS